MSALSYRNPSATFCDKPAAETKSFSGECTSGTRANRFFLARDSVALWILVWCEQLPETLSIFCAGVIDGVIDIAAEFLVHVVVGAIRAVCRALTFRAISFYTLRHNFDHANSTANSAGRPGVRCWTCRLLQMLYECLRAAASAMLVVDFALLSSGEMCEVEVNDGEFTAKIDVDFDDDFAAIYVAR